MAQELNAYKGDVFIPVYGSIADADVYLKKAVDAVLAEKDAEIRRLNRALWLARADRANEHYHRYHGKFLCPLEDIPEYVKWKQVERKCRAKAEECNNGLG